jgi:hypothetical protein
MPLFAAIGGGVFVAGLLLSLLGPVVFAVDRRALRHGNVDAFRRKADGVVAKLILDIERSVQMRTMLRQKLASNQEVDLVEEWKEIEQLDLEIVRNIRKRPIE